MKADRLPRASVALRVFVASGFIFSAGCATTSSSTPAATRKTSEKIEKTAERSGMVRVPLILTGQNSALVEMTMNGKPIILLLDTGAQSTVIDLRVATEAGVKSSSNPMYSHGVGAGRVAARQGDVVTLDMSGFQAHVRPTLQDFSALTNSWLAKGGKPIVGLLGYDVLRAYSAIIDLNEGAMYLRKQN